MTPKHIFIIGFEFEGLYDTYKSLKYVEKPTESSLKISVALGHC